MKSNEKKKLLFIATRQFWPSTSGRETTLYYNCKGLHEHYGYDVDVLFFSDKSKDKQKPAPDFIHKAVALDAPPIWKMVWNVLTKTLFCGWPIQCAMFYSRTLRKQIQAYYQELNPSAVIIDMVRLAPYGELLRGEPVNKVLNEEDLLAKRYRRQLSSTDSGSIAGYMAASFPGVVNKLTSVGFLRNAILRGEIKRLERYERKCVELFDHVTFISQIEADEFNGMYGTNKAIKLTLGADIAYCSGGVPDEHRENSLSIVGNFYTPANMASLKWINTEIMPRLPKETKLYAMGKYPEEVNNELNSDQIIMLGYVDDFRSIVKSTEIYLSPIVFGTGIKTKIVEAMAMGMPVVTNTIGAEGLDVHSGEELFIADDPQELVDITLRLLDDPELRKEVGMRGQRYVQENHDWNKIYSVFSEIGL